MCRALKSQLKKRVIGAIHDQITGAFMLTKTEVEDGLPSTYNKREALSILSMIDWRGDLPNPIYIDGALTIWDGFSSPW